MEGFREHIAINDSLDGFSGRDAVCGWLVVHLDFDKEEDPWCVIHGKMWADLEVQRTIKRAVLWAFTIVLSCLIGPSTIHTENMGNIDALWRGQEGWYILCLIIFCTKSSESQGRHQLCV